ncbi:DUF4167 domain-containing protein [Pontibaca salina]|uniref:DUF4167 domain-containing protein n=1 Tax=Pontibaca salina TaxID=2795731 RepID=A0A934M1M3_9RHOB|nr:DUF4167 domain-containing protein [Pontibaca salina]MBI6629786.1 DUF4167 domain-containing protein [Pontibaca salina]
MRSSKPRSRSRTSRNRPSSGGNVVNRVFDSSGPEGKVRGTPQQVIDKYNQLARDAQLSNDRVATENFQQHAEHYLRLLSEAQREIEARREEQEARREEQERQNRERQAERDRERAERQEREAAAEAKDAAQSEVVDSGSESSSNLVETPESAPKKPARRSPARSRKPAAKKANDEVKSDGDADSGKAAAAE